MAGTLICGFRDLLEWGGVEFVGLGAVSSARIGGLDCSGWVWFGRRNEYRMWWRGLVWLCCIFFLCIGTRLRFQGRIEDDLWGGEEMWKCESSLYYVWDIFVKLLKSGSTNRCRHNRCIFD